MTRSSTRARLADDLRARGLPLMLLPADRRRGLLARSAPGLLAWVIILVGLAVVGGAVAELASAADEGSPLETSEAAFVTFTVGVVLVLLAPAVGVIASYLVRRHPRPARLVSLVCATVTAVLPLLPGVAQTSPWWLRLAGIGVVLTLTYFGAGSMVGWALRRVTGEIGHVGPMVSRVLPILMLSVLFFFFNAEIWQIANHLSTARTWGAVGVFTLLCLALAAANAGDGLRQLLDEHADPGPAGLRPSERTNVHVVGIMVTLIQATVFAAVVFLFFIAFGALSVSEETVRQWVGGPATSLGPPFEEMGVSWPLVQVSLILAAFSALSFIASTGSDPTYRGRFVEPLLEQLRDGLEVRQQYLAATDPPAPRREEDQEDPAPPA